MKLKKIVVLISEPIENLGIVLIVLKIFKLITIPWWLVTMPFLIIITMCLIVAFISGLIAD